MELELTKGWDGVNEFITDKPTEQLIAELVSSLDWQQFHAITLKTDDQNWVSVSGNLAADGLALVYEESGESTVADFEPETTADLIEILQLYLRGDERYKKLRPLTFPDSASKPQLNDDLRPGANQKNKSKTDRGYRIISFIIAIVVIGSITSILYLWSQDELKFVGHETDHTTAVVTSTESHYSGTKITHYVTYEFEYEGQPYSGYFKGKLKYRKHEAGDLVRVKFSKDDPNISKRVATYKKDQ